MSNVDFFTFCYPGDIIRLSQPGELESRVLSHGYSFNTVNVIRQRCDHDFDNIVFSSNSFTVTEWRTEDFPNILQDFNLPEVDEQAEEFYRYDPPYNHIWTRHCINHLIGLKISQADYIVFSDCDCRMDHQPSSWVNVAIDILNRYNDALIVCPSEGGYMEEKRIGNIRFTQNVSQQLFCCERARFKTIDFNVPWNWEVKCPGDPAGVYYWMLEGRIWRYMHKNNLYRAILPIEWRYSHDGWN